MTNIETIRSASTSELTARYDFVMSMRVTTRNSPDRHTWETRTILKELAERGVAA